MRLDRNTTIIAGCAAAAGFLFGWYWHSCSQNTSASTSVEKLDQLNALTPQEAEAAIVRLTNVLGINMFGRFCKNTVDPDVATGRNRFGAFVTLYSWSTSGAEGIHLCQEAGEIYVALVADRNKPNTLESVGGFANHAIPGDAKTLTKLTDSPDMDAAERIVLAEKVSTARAYARVRDAHSNAAPDYHVDLTHMDTLRRETLEELGLNLSLLSGQVDTHLISVSQGRFRSGPSFCTSTFLVAHHQGRTPIPSADRNSTEIIWRGWVKLTDIKIIDGDGVNSRCGNAMIGDEEYTIKPGKLEMILLGVKAACSKYSESFKLPKELHSIMDATALSSGVIDLSSAFPKC